MVYGNLTLKNGVILAPMAGVADLAFRELCMEYGAELCVTEMVSAKALVYGSANTYELIEISDASRPCALQLFGHEADFLSKAALIAVSKAKPDMIDINMGCPAPKIVKNGEGSALMKDPQLVYELTAAVRDVLPPEIALTVKLRSGFSSQDRNAVVCAQKAEEAGAAAVTIHGRTRDRFYTPPVELDAIKEVKTAVGIPVIGNGDIYSFEEAAKMLSFTGCDGIMVGRGALGNPFIFEELKAGFEGKKYSEPSLAQRLETAQRHISMIVDYKGEKTGMLEARKHFAWYIKGIRGGAAYRQAANQLSDMKGLLSLIDKIKREAGECTIQKQSCSL